MKTAFIFFLLGAIVGAFALNFYNHRDSRRALTEPATSLTDKARDGAIQTKDAIANKLDEWHLSSDDIKRDLARTGQVVRSKAADAGDKISDARILTVIKSKYVLDSDLSAIDINVDCKDGEVTLNGSVVSTNLIGRAVVLALDTSGVRDVTSKLVVSVK